MCALVFTHVQYGREEGGGRGTGEEGEEGGREGRRREGEKGGGHANGNGEEADCRRDRVFNFPKTFDCKQTRKVSTRFFGSVVSVLRTLSATG